MAEKYTLETPFDIPLTSKIRGYRYLTCQGAGVKGTTLLGALELLESIGVISQLEAIAGCSVSAIFASLIAVGYTTKEIREELNTLDFNRLRNKYNKAALEWSQYAGKKTFPPLQTYKSRRRALEQLSVVQQRYQKALKISETFQHSEDAIRLAFNRKMGLWKEDALLTVIQRLIARKTGKLDITFKDLSIRAKAEIGVFKNLVLTGSNLLTQEIEYYNAENWPDMPIIDALRISLSFPAGYLPVIKPILKRSKGKERGYEYSLGLRLDGGLLENIPDVFNHPPYFHPKEENKANPEVLALAFVEQYSKSLKETECSFLGSLYITSLTAAKHKKKYADNIIYINTGEFGPLDFKKEKQNREKLLALGWQAVHQALKKVLLEESQNKAIAEMSLDELLRHRAFALCKSKNSTSQNLPALNECIDKAVKKQRISSAELSVKEKFELLKAERLVNMWGEESYGSKAEILNNREKNRLASAHRKWEELKNFSIEQDLQINELSLLLSGFELRKLDFLEKYHNPSNKEWREHLESNLSVITDFRSREDQYKTKLSNLEKEYEVIKNKYEKNMITEAQYKVAKVRIAMHKKHLNNMLIDLTFEREKFIKSGVIAYYKGKHDTFLCHFFEELNEEFDKVSDLKTCEKTESYRFPKKINDMITFIEHEQRACEIYLKEARLIKKVTTDEVEHFKTEWTILNKFFHKIEKPTTSPLSVQVQNVKDLEIALDHALNEKKEFSAKVNQYFVSDSALLKNHCIRAVMKLRQQDLG